MTTETRVFRRYLDLDIIEIFWASEREIKKGSHYPTHFRASKLRNGAVTNLYLSIFRAERMKRWWDDK